MEPDDCDKPYDSMCDDASPCFGREMHACLVIHALPAPEAFSICFGDTTGTGAALTLLAELRSGDTVLDSAGSMSRVIVNEHVHSLHKSPLLTITTKGGELVVTPDHYVAADGGYTAAGKASALVGALGEALPILRSSVHVAEVVNPITVSGRLLVATATGAPLVATTYGGWIADTALRFGGVLTRVSLSSGISYGLPVSAQVPPSSTCL